MLVDVSHDWLTTPTIGGTVIVVTYLILKYRPWRSEALPKIKFLETAGELTPAEWEDRFRRLLHDSNMEFLQNVETYMKGRNEDIRNIVRQEIDRIKKT